MEGLLDALGSGELVASIEYALAEAKARLQDALRIWTLIQLGLIAASFGVATLLSSRLDPRFEALMRRLRDRRTLRVLVVLRRRLRAILFLGLLWLSIAVVREVTPPGNSDLLAVVASLVSAWVVIAIASRLIRNPTLATLVAGLAWTIAALNILGLLPETLALLDAIGITFGEARISLLTISKGVLSLIALIGLALWVSRRLEARISRLPDLTPSVQVLLGKLLKIGLLTLALVVALQSVGVDLTALTVLSGAIGLGIGFGLQKVVSNLISGIILLLDKSIKPGDVISLGETFGWITSLGARYVSVITRDGREYLIPNEDLITHQVINWSYSDQMVRLEVSFGVSYGSDPHRVRKVVREAAARPARVATDPAPVCHLTGFGDSSLDFLLRFWIRDPAKGVVNVKGEVMLEIWDAFQREGIAIPYPHRELILRQPVRVAALTESAGVHD